MGQTDSTSPKHSLNHVDLGLVHLARLEFGLSHLNIGQS